MTTGIPLKVGEQKQMNEKDNTKDCETNVINLVMRLKQTLL